MKTLIICGFLAAMTAAGQTQDQQQHKGKMAHRRDALTRFINAQNRISAVLANVKEPEQAKTIPQGLEQAIQHLNSVKAELRSDQLENSGDTRDLLKEKRDHLHESSSKLAGEVSRVLAIPGISQPFRELLARI